MGAGSQRRPNPTRKRGTLSLAESLAHASGWDSTFAARFDDLVADVARHNPHCGEFYTELADMLQVRHKHAAAERYFREAIRTLPKQPAAYVGLGMLLMRSGPRSQGTRRCKRPLTPTRSTSV